MGRNLPEHRTPRPSRAHRHTRVRVVRLRQCSIVDQSASLILGVGMPRKRKTLSMHMCLLKDQEYSYWIHVSSGRAVCSKYGIQGLSCTRCAQSWTGKTQDWLSGTAEYWRRPHLGSRCPSQHENNNDTSNRPRVHTVTRLEELSSQQSGIRRQE